MSWIPSYKKPQSAPEPPTIVQWSTGTDEEIVAMVEAHYQGIIDLHDYWAVGDTRTVSLSAMSATGVGESHAAQNVTFVLSNVGGKTLSDGTTTCAFQVDQLHCLNENGYMHGSSTTTGWKTCARRTWCNDVYKNAIPATLRPIFKEFINQSSIGDYYGTAVENTADYFALRSEIEVIGSQNGSAMGEGTQVNWYTTSSNRIKNVNGMSYVWWERSRYLMSNYEYCVIIKQGGAGYGTCTNTFGLAPFGVI